ncbi:MAG: PaeR7I family type II restriction endonuclease [Nitrospirota bacterium]
MLLDLADYKIKTRSAVKTFWTSSKKAGTKNRAAGNMAGFIDLVIDVVHANGLTDADIIKKSKRPVLPGHFCPTQSWDLLVMNHGNLIAALKYESLVSMSFAKNSNCGCKDALSIAMDLQAAYRQGTFGEYRRPFVGYLIFLEDGPAVRSPVKDVSPNYRLLPEFRSASYADRYKILCEKLIAEGLYTAASVILSPRTASKTGAYSEMSDLTGLKPFVAALAGHIAAEAAM